MPSPPFRCEQCFQEFRYKQSLHRHLKRHRGEKTFSCSICTRAFVTKWDLKQHEESHNARKSYVCDICGKAYKQNAGLYTHKFIHSKDFKFSCSFCEDKFKTWRHLRRHVKSIHEEKPQCPVCGKRFSDLTGHLKVCGLRDRVANFACNFCDKKFKSAKTLKEHSQYSHLDPERYSCPRCGGRFAHRKTLSAHVKKCPSLFIENTSVEESAQ